MNCSHLGFAAVIFSVALIGLAPGQTTWTGNVNNVWTESGNWDGGLPGDAYIGDTAVAREISNAGGTISGFTWDQSSGAVSQITLGADLDVSAGPRTFNNTSGSAGNTTGQPVASACGADRAKASAAAISAVTSASVASRSACEQTPSATSFRPNTVIGQRSCHAASSSRVR